MHCPVNKSLNSNFTSSLLPSKFFYYNIILLQKKKKKPQKIILGGANLNNIRCIKELRVTV